MKEKKIVFVILHYVTIDDTIKCVNSIKELNYNNKEIVIVDNNSNNNTGIELKKMYKEDKGVHLILSKENLGFARGNNLGFKFAKEKLKADFIILCNNDTIILQKNLIDLILSKYNNYKYSVLGPKIILKNNKVNKLYKKLPTVKEFKKTIIMLKFYLLFNYLGLENIIRKLKHLIFGINITECDDLNIEHFNVVLHGCFLIFSPIYIEKFDGLDDRTFLYGEEELLAIRLLKNNLNSIYYPKVEIYHDEDSSTRVITKNNNKRNRFRYKNQLKSCKIILEELKKISNRK